MDTSLMQLWKLTLLLFTGSQWKAQAKMDLWFCCFPNIFHTVTRGEKIHNCDICGKSYPRLSTLKLHKKTHRTTKEFQCLYCNQQYGAGGKRNIVSAVLLIKLWTNIHFSFWQIVHLKNSQLRLLTWREPIQICHASISTTNMMTVSTLWFLSKHWLSSVYCGKAGGLEASEQLKEGGETHEQKSTITTTTTALLEASSFAFPHWMLMFLSSTTIPTNPVH